jgi:hypothetical protein
MKTRNSKVLEDAKTLLAAIGTFEKEFSLGEGTDLKSFEKIIVSVEGEEKAYNNELVEVSKKRIGLNDRNKELRELKKRFKNGVKMKYGEESAEYEMVGGKRPSQRKSYVRAKRDSIK